jgi:pimeloyl-ACP methyl ester carboxylesterase
MPYKASRTEKIDVRGLRYNVRHWGPDDAPMVFFLHGWMDCSPTFQFVVDALSRPWHVIAPDWRGHGESEWQNRPYWHPDYYADLDVLLAHYSPKDPARIVGHSMGANVGASYAGVRPRRVAQLVMLDFLGLSPPAGEDSPRLFDAWLRQVDEEPAPRVYPNCEALAARLKKTNPRLTTERAAFLSRHASRANADGTVQIACDPWHRVPSPLVYRIEDSLACWRRIEIPVLLMIAEHGFVRARFGKNPRELERRLSSFRDLATESVPGSGHNMQHDRPECVAKAIEHVLSKD